MRWRGRSKLEGPSGPGRWIRGGRIVLLFEGNVRRHWAADAAASDERCMFSEYIELTATENPNNEQIPKHQPTPQRYPNQVPDAKSATTASA
jgi:hypothetical protein